MNDASTPTRWPRMLWDWWSREAMEAGVGIGLSPIRCWCPLCPARHPLFTMTLTGVGSFPVPAREDWDSTGLVIRIVDGASESTVEWEPCGHTVIVHGRLDEPSPRPDFPEEWRL